MRPKPPAREDLPQHPTTRHHVKSLTLGDIAAGVDQVIEAECEWCRHTARLEVAPLAAKYGAHAAFGDLKEHLICSKCGWRRVEARPIGPHKDYRELMAVGGRRPTRPVPYPPLAECRAVLAAVPKMPDIAYEQHHAYMAALTERWPDIGADRALIVIRHLVPEIEAEEESMMPDTGDALLREIVEILDERPYQAKGPVGPFQCVFCGAETADERQPQHDVTCPWPRILRFVQPVH